MKFTQATSFGKRSKTDLLVLPLTLVKEKIHWPAHLDKSPYELPVKLGDFKAKEKDITLLYDQNERVILVGLGDVKTLSVEKLRQAFSRVTKAALQNKVKSLSVVIPEIDGLSDQDIVRGAIEGLLLSNYTFDQLKTKKEDNYKGLESIQLITSEKHALDIAEKALTICEGVYLARDLVNGNADDVTPQYLALLAKSYEKKHSKIKTTILDRKKLEKEKMGLLLAVNRGSARDPVLIVTEYKGNPSSKERTVIVGKGITYDTGGLNIKQTGGMETMKCDMGGAAAALVALLVAANLGLKQNIAVVIPSTENMVDSKSYKPGDVYKSYAGKTVEITNTDAEGRLVLADALAYAVKHLKPTRIIDLATLTGAIEIALGPDMSGLFSNDEKLAEALQKASSTTYERLWRMPLTEEYKELLKTDIADLRNQAGRAGSSIIGALFLQEFVNNTPWAHLDIAATAYLSEPKRYNPKFATGFGVRLLVDFLENL